MRSATHRQPRWPHSSRRIAGALPALTLLAVVAVVPLRATDLGDNARRAYDDYAARATAAFEQRVAASLDAPAAATRTTNVTVRPAAEDGILSVSGGLLHHWSGTSFVPGASIDEALAVSQAYDDYPRMYKPIASSRLLERDGRMFRVRFRVRESAAGRTVVLDVTSRVVYNFPRAGAFSSISNSEVIREVVDAGTPMERLLPAGHDSGYLWRAATLTAIVARNGGLAVTMETIALSRGFPPMLGWVIEPIARRLGRKSVEQSLQEFDDAVLAHRSAGAVAPDRVPGERK